MTGPTAEQHTVRNHSAPNHTRERRWRRDILFALMAFAVGVLTVVIGAVINNQRQYETNRADNALVALEQACDQVTRLGGQCVVEPSEVKGDAAPTSIPGKDGRDGKDGAPGRPPTKAEIDAAVADYFLANPPPSGQPGQPGIDGAPGADGAPGETCPGHLELLTFKLANGGGTITILACVPN